jgi:hypothetical protein
LKVLLSKPGLTFQFNESKGYKKVQSRTEKAADEAGRVKHLLSYLLKKGDWS